MRSKLINIVKALLPHGYVAGRKRNRFLEEYDAWKKDRDCDFTFDKTCCFSSFVTIDGYGCSGSSAVMDLLREYSNCTVWATKPSFAKDSSLDTADCVFGEFDICRHTGGLLFLEHMMQPEAWVNDFWADAAVKDFINVAYYSDVYQKYEETRPLFFLFFDSIIGQRMTSDTPLMNVWQNRFSGINDMFTLKKMSKEYYHTLCRGFLYTLCNTLFKNSGKNNTLVLDHIFGDCGTDMARFEPYLPGVKRIIVDRDVRAVYVHAKKKDIRWIAHDSVEEFIEWEKKMHYCDNKGNEGNCTLKLQFEDVVLNYEKEVSKVEHFLGFSKENHNKKKQIFNPEISIKNVFAWKDAKAYEADCSRIKELIPDCCYGE